MKITTTLTIAASLLLAAGCASREERQARYQESTTSSPTYQSWGSSSENTTSTSHRNDYSGGYSGSAGGYSGSTAGSGTAGASAYSTTSPSDTIVVTEIRQSLSRNTELAPIISGIQITENNGAVTLSGTVPSQEQKQRIESLVQQTTGVTQVNNQINVTSQPSSGQGTSQDPGMSPTSRTGSDTQMYPQGSQPSDTSGSTNQNQSSTSDQSSLSATGQAAGSSTTSSGASGTSSGASMGSSLPGSTSGSSDPSASGGASSQFGTQSGSQASPSSPSAAGITINIRGTSPGDQVIVQQVRQDLQADASLAPVLARVQITITDGNATLSGNVSDEQQKQQVEAAVKKSTGVTSVSNQLQAGSAGSLRPTSGSTNSSERIYHEPSPTPK